MKYSQYNSIIPISDNHEILYNARSDEFVVLKHGCKQDIYKLTADELLKKNKGLFDIMCKSGCIIDDNIDEKSDLAQQIDKIDNDNSFFILHINPTMDCNFKCWYCYENHIVGSAMSDETINSVCKFIHKTISTNTDLKYFQISFFGGEPLMRFSSVVKPLIDYVIQICSLYNVVPYCQFTTNGYLLTQEMIDYFNSKNVSFQITLDGGRQSHNSTRYVSKTIGSFDTILSNIITLASHGHNIILRINYTADNINLLNDIVESITEIGNETKKNIVIDFQRVWQDCDSNYAERDKDIYDKICRFKSLFIKNGYSVSSKRYDLVKNSCYGDKRNHLLINYNGDVFNCTARDFTKENCSGKITSEGKIMWIDNALEKRMHCKFDKQVCHKCRIAPLCGGGCRQQALEHITNDNNICMYGYTDSDLDKIILDRFEDRYIRSDI